jgi:4a-hydroxytetrahydrobiopterin dehydratase
MVDRLDEALVESSLSALPNWAGDATSISRTVEATPAQADVLIKSLGESADAMDHHPEIERTGSGLRIVLSTHSADGVTSLDIAMASVIEDLVASATGQPAQHVHHDPMTETPDEVPDDA